LDLRGSKKGAQVGGVQIDPHCARPVLSRLVEPSSRTPCVDPPPPRFSGLSKMKRILTTVRPATLLRALVPHTHPHQPQPVPFPISPPPRCAGDPIQQASARQPSWGGGAMARRCGPPRLDVQRLHWARMMTVGAGASVDASARVHPSAEIGPGAVILGGVEVGCPFPGDGGVRTSVSFLQQRVVRERTPGPSCPQSPAGGLSTWPCWSCNQ